MQQSFITADLLDEYGIVVTPEEKDALLTHLNTTLEERVGTEITESLSDEQLKELLDLQEKASDEQVGAWLNNNVPELKEIVQDEIDALLGELAESTGSINETE